MGAWGYGILQNDNAQDGLLELVGDIYDDMIALGSEPASRAAAARLGAGAGLLLQLSASPIFSVKDKRWAPLREVLVLHEKGFAALPPEADRILADILAGKGQELAARKAPPDARLDGALLAEDSQEERAFGYREPALFADPDAARYVQEVADRLAEQVDGGVRDDDMASDPSREADFMAALAVLLILEPCRIDPDRFASWRELFREVYVDPEPGDPTESEFYAAYSACLEQALQIGIDRFSKEGS